MRGLLMAFFAFEFPGHGLAAAAGRLGARARFTRITAKTTTKTV